MDITVGQGGGTSALSSMGTAPLVTVDAPLSGSLVSDNPASDTMASSPLDVIVGQGTDPNAQGSLLAVTAPVTANGTLTGAPNGTGTTLPLTNLGQQTVGGLSGATGSSGPLVAANLPVDVNGAGTGTSPVIPASLGSNALLGTTPGPGTLVNVSSPLAVSTNGATASPASTTVPLINLG